MDSIFFQVEWAISALNRASSVYDVDMSVSGVLQHARSLLAELNEEPCYGYEPMKIFTGCQGRPKYGYSLKLIGQMIGVSSKSVYRKLKESGLSTSANLTPTEDDQLDLIINDILKDFPNWGYKHMTSFLRARGLQVQQSKIRESMQRTDPEGVFMRSLQLTTIHRRSYSVRCPCQLWHMDGNHKKGVQFLFFPIFSYFLSPFLFSPIF